MIPIKICGISNIESLKIVLKYPVSAIGFIFYNKSPRFITPIEATELSKHIPQSIKKVGVFVNEKVEKIKQICNHVKLDFIQLHGNERQDYINNFSTPIIKAIRVGNDFTSQTLKNYKVHSFLLDTFQPGIFGGTGETFNWDLIKKLESPIPIILSGGLNPQNILTAVNNVNPSAIDINSGVEKCPGEKDELKISTLFNNLTTETQNINIFNEI
ncbi:MAG: phosphoribosylanthranilate isomerase [Candidatus Marinimicrobia bacterium]|nr:phosphoribosylanthranilate isomerase [Candidatus Neomarinimicrobiota bacterium]